MREQTIAEKEKPAMATKPVNFDQIELGVIKAALMYYLSGTERQMNSKNVTDDFKELYRKRIKEIRDTAESIGIRL